MGKRLAVFQLTMRGCFVIIIVVFSRNAEGKTGNIFSNHCIGVLIA